MTSTMSEFVRDDETVCAFVTTDNKVQVTAFINWNGTADISIGSLSEGDAPANKDDCFELAQFFLAMSKRLREMEFCNTLDSIGNELAEMRNRGEATQEA